MRSVCWKELVSEGWRAQERCAATMYAVKRCAATFFFILVYFSAHGFSIVNILRQLRHDAGGFSYKSTWTLQELFPLIILVVNVDKLNTHKNI